MTTTNDPLNATAESERGAPGDPNGAVATARPIAAMAAISAGIVVLIASEFIPAGVLPLLARDLAVTEGQAGLMVAATALAGAVTAPTITSAIPRLDRKLALVALIGMTVAANLIVALAPSFPLLLIGRVILGVAISGFWSMAFSVGVRILPGREAAVSTTLAASMSVATILTVPLASIAADAIGWRAVFGAIAALGAVAGCAAALLLSRVPALPSAGFRMMRETLRHRRLLVGLLGVALVATANFTAYPYIRLAIERVDPSLVAVLLAAWGLGGLTGNFLAGALARWLRIAVTVAPIVLALALAGMAAADGALALALAVVGWGIGFNMFPAVSQIWVSALEPRRVEAAVSLQVTAFQVAITVGSFAGGVLVDQHGTSAAMLAGAGCAALGALVFAVTRVVPRTD